MKSFRPKDDGHDSSSGGGLFSQAGASPGGRRLGGRRETGPHDPLPPERLEGNEDRQGGRGCQGTGNNPGGMGHGAAGKVGRIEEKTGQESKTFGVGYVKDNGELENMYMAASDVAGVALAGVKELFSENRRLEQRVADLESLVQQLLAQER